MNLHSITKEEVEEGQGGEDKDDHRKTTSQEEEHVDEEENSEGHKDSNLNISVSFLVYNLLCHF